MFYYEKFLMCNIRQRFTFEMPLYHPMGTTVELYDNLAAKSISSYTVNKKYLPFCKKRYSFDLVSLADRLWEQFAKR